MSYGFIYFATNPAMPGLTKIGHTGKHPQERLKELSAASGCPLPFELLAFFGHENSAKAERDIHQYVAKYRMNDRREFFALTNGQLQDIARSWGDQFLDAFVVDELDMLVERDQIKVA